MGLKQKTTVMQTGNRTGRDLQERRVYNKLMQPSAPPSAEAVEDAVEVAEDAVEVAEDAAEAYDASAGAAVEDAASAGAAVEDAFDRTIALVAPRQRSKISGGAIGALAAIVVGGIGALIMRRR